MAAIIKDIVIDAGDDVNIPFTLLDPSSTRASVTGYSARMQVRPSPLSGTKALDVTDTDYLPITPGKCTLELPHAISALVVPGAYVYAIEVSDTSGETYRAYEGACKVTPEVVR
jgi:hypothetical protein